MNFRICQRLVVVLAVLAGFAVFNAAAQVADPVLSATSGTSSSTVTVTVNDSTPGATIYYTTDGSTPTASSPSVTSGSAVVINQNAIFKVQAFQGSGSSDVITAFYTVNGLVTSSGQHALALKNDGTLWAGEQFIRTIGWRDDGPLEPACTNPSHGRQSDCQPHRDPRPL